MGEVEGVPKECLSVIERCDVPNKSADGTKADERVEGGKEQERGRYLSLNSRKSLSVRL